MPTSKICAVCNKEFTVPNARALTAKTCSQKCRGVLIARAYEEQRVEHRCKWCGSSFKTPKCFSGKRVYCSYKCAGDAQRGVPTGPFAQDGAITIHSGGYVLERATIHPFRVGDYVLQHRLVMEAWLREESPEHLFLIEVDGVKYLRRDIHVHHRNESKADNQRQNLLACTPAAHRDLHDGRLLMLGTVWPESGNEIAAVDRRVFGKCLECGLEIANKLSHVRRGGGKFCSLICKAAWHGQKSKTKVKRTCFQCGTEFEVWPAYVAAGKGKFCSNACRHKARVGRSRDEVIPYVE